MIIDAHIHLLRPEMMPDTNPEYLKQLTSAYTSYGAYIRLCFTPTQYNHTRQGWVTCDRMIEVMDEEGIDKVAALGPEDEYLAACYRKYPDRLIPFFRVSMPDLKKNLKDELQKMRFYIESEGFFGFGEFHPDIAGYDLYAPEILAVMELAQELNVPVNIHASEPVGHFYYGKSQNPPEEYYWLAKRYPELKLILAHWGGGLCFYEAIPQVRQVLKNVYYDTTASKLFFDVRKSMEQITKIVDPQKIFYGSDYPILLHPVEHPDELNPRFIWDRNDFVQTELPAHVLNGIMGDNFARFIGILDGGDEGQQSKVSKKPLNPNSQEKSIRAATPVSEIVRNYPQVSVILEKYGIPAYDRRLPPWMGLIQTLAQHGIWYEDEFIDELRSAIPRDDPLQDLDDLTLVHEKTRSLANRFPKVRALLKNYNLPDSDIPLPSWETLEQAAATRGIWPVDVLLAEISDAIIKGGD